MTVTTLERFENRGCKAKTSEETAREQDFRCCGTLSLQLTCVTLNTDYQGTTDERCLCASFVSGIG